MNKILFPMLLLCVYVWADQTYTKNSKANRLYSQGKYEEALKLYEDALLESPSNHKLSINKGSALHKMGDFDEAEKSYESALSVKDKQARADVHYNLGNTNFRQGQQLEMSGNQQAMEKYKAAYENYIKALDLRPKDRDAKYNLQLAYQRIKKLEQQQQDKNKDQKQDQKNQQNKNNQKQQDKNKQDQQQDKKDEQKQDKEKQQQQKRDQQQDKQKQQPQPQPKKQKSDMEKKEAQRLLQQYADDADELNKPRKKVRAAAAGQPEKDW